MSTKSEIMLANEAFLAQLDNPAFHKQATDAVNDFTRIKMREDGFFRKIMPPVTISNDDLDRQVDTDNPVVIIDKENDNPPAQSVPFATLPSNQYIRGNRYKVTFDRIVSPRFTKDVEQLRTWNMDIRQVMSDNAIKDMMAEEDGKFITAVNAALVGQNALTVASGTAQWQTVSGGITRTSTQDALKIMPSTPWHIETDTVLCNNVTIREVLKWGRDEVGGDFAQDMLKNGWSEARLMNVNFVVTIKRDLVPDDTFFMFGANKFMGKHFLLEDTVLYLKREAFMLEFFAYQCSGATLQSNALARADFV